MDTGPQTEPSWFTRNWKWLVPVMVIAPIFFSCSCFVGALIGIQRIVRQQPVYQQAWSEVRQHPEVVRELGQPVEEGWLAQSLYETIDGRDTATVTFNIDGPVGEGTVQVAGVEEAGQWTLTGLMVFTRGGPGGDVIIPIIDPDAAK